MLKDNCIAIIVNDGKVKYLCTGNGTSPDHFGENPWDAAVFSKIFTKTSPKTVAEYVKKITKENGDLYYLLGNDFSPMFEKFYKGSDGRLVSWKIFAEDLSKHFLKNLSQYKNNESSL